MNNLDIMIMRVLFQTGICSTRKIEMFTGQYY